MRANQLAEKVENVVNAPNIPVVKRSRNELDGLYLINRPFRIPNMALPIPLTTHNIHSVGTVIVTQ